MLTSNMIKLASVNIHLDDDGIVNYHFKDNADVDLEEARQIAEETLSLVKGKPYCSLVEARNIFGTISHEARQFLAEHKEIQRLRMAEAFLVNNLPVRLIVGFYLKHYNYSNPAKVFKEKHLAKDWLLKYQETVLSH